VSPAFRKKWRESRRAMYGMGREGRRTTWFGRGFFLLACVSRGCSEMGKNIYAHDILPGIFYAPTYAADASAT